MAELKDSGEKWLGLIPANWKIVYPKAIFRPRKEKARPDDVMLTASQHYGMIPQESFIKKQSYTPVAVEKGHDILKHVELGDFVISMRSFQGGLEYCRIRGKMSSAYIALEVIDERVDPEYFKWLLKSERYISMLQSTTNLVRDGQALRFANIIQGNLPLPPYEEQASIASYIDKKCAEIDKAIDAAKASTEEYKLYKKSVIFQAVTKGLDPNVPMKDSGIEWTASLPSHWRIPRWKNVLSERNKTNKEGEVKEILSLSASQGVVPYSERVGGGNKAKEDLTAYKIAYAGDIVLNSMNVVSGSVALSAYDGCVSPVYYMYYPSNSKDDARYFNYVFQTTPFQLSLFGLGNGIMVKQSSTGKLNTVRMRISSSTLNSLPLPYPPAGEQKEISDFLDLKCIEIDRLINAKQQIVEELKAYKKSFIWETVTGKREVSCL